METQSPILARVHDLLLWLLPHTARWPKHLRHSLTLTAEGEAIDLLLSLVRANVARGERRAANLQAANEHLEGLRALLRLSHDLGVLSSGELRHAATIHLEVGRLLGGWTKKTKGSISP